MALRRPIVQRSLALVITALLATAVLLGAGADQAEAKIGPIPTPCDMPVAGSVCKAIGDVATTVASEAGEFVMRGLTVWVTNAAVWVTGKVGSLVEATSTPDLTAGWFEGQYGAMLTVASALALMMLMLGAIQALIRQDAGMLLRSAFGYLPMAFILSGVAIAGTGLLVAITDDISAGVVNGLGTEQSTSLLQGVGDAFKNALDSSSGIPLFGVFLGAIVLAIGAFVLWLEMIIRDAAIYICVFFLPLTFVAMIWPATSRWARRLVELLVAIILAKFVIVAILSLATAAIANTNVVNGEGNTFERMIAGAALLVLAAWSPFALLRLIPMMEGAASSVVGQRSSMSAAAGSAGVHSPAVYMRQAMDRSSKGWTSPPSPASGGTTYASARSSERSTERQSSTGPSGSPGPRGRDGAAASTGRPSEAGGGTVYAPVRPPGRTSSVPTSPPAQTQGDHGTPAAPAPRSAAQPTQRARDDTPPRPPRRDENA